MTFSRFDFKKLLFKCLNKSIKLFVYFFLLFFYEWRNKWRNNAANLHAFVLWMKKWLNKWMNDNFTLKVNVQVSVNSHPHSVPGRSSRILFEDGNWSRKLRRVRDVILFLYVISTFPSSVQIFYSMIMAVWLWQVLCNVCGRVSDWGLNCFTFLSHGLSKGVLVAILLSTISCDLTTFQCKVTVF
jgi:hypothetical protein